MKILSKRIFEEAIKFPAIPTSVGWEWDSFYFDKYFIKLYYTGKAVVYECGSYIEDGDCLFEFQSSRILDKTKYNNFKEEVLLKGIHNNLDENFGNEDTK